MFNHTVLTTWEATPEGNQVTLASLLLPGEGCEDVTGQQNMVPDPAVCVWRVTNSESPDGAHLNDATNEVLYSEDANDGTPNG